jgi:hemin uptake protein HemP
MSERMDAHRTAEPSPSLAEGEPPQALRRAPLRSEQLLQGHRMVEITHNGEVYRLQTTRLGKLILTK